MRTTGQHPARAWALLVILLAAAAAPARADDPKKHAFDIPAGPLVAGLERFSDTVGLDVVAGESVEGIDAPALRGEFTADEALNRLLAGTGLTCRFTGEKTVAITTRAKATGAGEPVGLDAQETEGEMGEAELPETVVRGRTTAARTYRAEKTTTATRLPMDPRDVPHTINVVTQDLIEDRAADDLGEAVEVVPGVNRRNGFGNTFDEFTIRGFTFRNMFKNGMRQVRDNGFNGLENVERVEVLKGPASIMFGRIEPGGVINIITKRPLDEPAHEVGVQYNSFGSVRTYLDSTGPLNEAGSVRYRLNFSHKHGDYFPEFYDLERTFVAPTLAFDLGPDTSLRFEMEYLNDQRPFWRGQIAVGDRPADIPQERWLGEPWDESEVEVQSYALHLDHRFNEDWRLRHATRYMKTDVFNLAARPDGLRNDNRTLDRILFNTDTEKQNVVTQTDLSGALDTGSIEHRFSVGVDFIYEDGDVFGAGLRDPSFAIDIFNPVHNVPEPEVSDLDVFNPGTKSESTEVGVFVNHLMSIGPFKLMLGGRFDHTDISPAQDAADITDDVLTPRLGAIYEPVEGQAFFASYTESFVPFEATSFGRTADGGIPDPEEGEQFEFGLKSRWFDGRLDTTVSFLHIEKENVAQFTGQQLPSGFFEVEELGQVESRGIEFEAAGWITDQLQIQGGYAWIDAEIAGDNDPDNIGKRLTDTPEHQGSLWLNYHFPRGSLEGLVLGGGVVAKSFRVGDSPANSFKLPGFARFDARVAYAWRNLNFQVNFNNIFDKRHYRSGNRRDRFTPGEPFNVSAQLSMTF